jgi:hypothetical protein
MFPKSDSQVATGPMFPKDASSSSSAPPQTISSMGRIDASNDENDSSSSNGGGGGNGLTIDVSSLIIPAYEKPPLLSECTWPPPCFVCKTNPRHKGVAPFACHHNGLCQSCMQTEVECALCGETKKLQYHHR